MKEQKNDLKAKISIVGNILIIYNDLEIGLGNLVINHLLIKKGPAETLLLKNELKDLDYKTATQLAFFLEIVSLKVYQKLIEFRKNRNEFAHQSMSNQNLFEEGNMSDELFIKKGKEAVKLGVKLIDKIYGKLNAKEIFDQLGKFNPEIIEQLYRRNGKLR